METNTDTKKPVKKKKIPFWLEAGFPSEEDWKFAFREEIGLRD